MNTSYIQNPLSEKQIEDIRKNPDAQHSIDWAVYSIYNKLSENFIEEFENYVSWGTIWGSQNLSEGFIIRFLSKIEDEEDWQNVCMHQKLSEQFIRNNQKYFDKYCWMYISDSQKLSEEFIIEFADKVDWESISECQVLTDDFIFKYFERLDCFSLLLNKSISQETKDYIRMFI